MQREGRIMARAILGFLLGVFSLYAIKFILTVGAQRGLKEYLKREKKVKKEVKKK